MTVWRYIAVPREGFGSGSGAGTEARGAGGRQTGELVAESQAEVRASLRRIGLQVVDLRPVRRSRSSPRSTTAATSAPSFADLRREMRRAFGTAFHAYLRHRRRDQRAEIYDGLATMLASGMPLLETVETLIHTTKRRGSSLRWMLVQVREALRSGTSMGDAMEAHPTWFDGSETAMVRSGHHSGTLPAVLRSLAERHEHSGELSHKLAGALAYPTIVALVGLGVVIFLSVKTLPNLVQVLLDAGIEPPRLTERVMALGQGLATYGVPMLLVLLAVAALGIVVAGGAVHRGVELPRAVRRLSPRVLRRMAVARLSFQLSQMLRTGVPMVDALRVLAPTVRGPVLRRRLMVAAERVERGDELSEALDDEHWFDAEFRRLLDIGQASGELDVLLERLGHRYARQAARLIDRIATLLEPVVILTLAALIGVVAMAAILPLLRLQEIL